MQIENPLNESAVAFPLLGTVHLLGIVCLLGAVALIDLRLLGVGTQRSPSLVWRETVPITLAGLTVAIASGLLLFTIAAHEYFESNVFRIKMALLVAAIVFHFTMVRSAAARDRSAPVVAAVSLLFFALIPLGGILLGYD